MFSLSLCLSHTRIDRTTWFAVVDFPMSRMFHTHTHHLEKTSSRELPVLRIFSKSSKINKCNRVAVGCGGNLKAFNSLSELNTQSFISFPTSFTELLYFCDENLGFLRYCYCWYFEGGAQRVNISFEARIINTSFC